MKFQLQSACANKTRKIPAKRNKITSTVHLKFNTSHSFINASRSLFSSMFSFHFQSSATSGYDDEVLSVSNREKAKLIFHLQPDANDSRALQTFYNERRKKNLGFEIQIWFLLVLMQKAFDSRYIDMKLKLEMWFKLYLLECSKVFSWKMKISSTILSNLDCHRLPLVEFINSQLAWHNLDSGLCDFAFILSLSMSLHVTRVIISSQHPLKLMRNVEGIKCCEKGLTFKGLDISRDGKLGQFDPLHASFSWFMTIFLFFRVSFCFCCCLQSMNFELLIIKGDKNKFVWCIKRAHTGSRSMVGRINFHLSSDIA